MDIAPSIASAVRHMSLACAWRETSEAGVETSATLSFSAAILSTPNLKRYRGPFDAAGGEHDVSNLFFDFIELRFSRLISAIRARLFLPGRPAFSRHMSGRPARPVTHHGAYGEAPARQAIRAVQAAAVLTGGEEAGHVRPARSYR